jgi:hypothetical protein
MFSPVTDGWYAILSNSKISKTKKEHTKADDTKGILKEESGIAFMKVDAYAMHGLKLSEYSNYRTICSNTPT